MEENKKIRVLRLLIDKIIQSEGLEDIFCKDYVIYYVNELLLIVMEIKENKKISRYQLQKLIQNELSSWVSDTVYVNVMEMTTSCEDKPNN
jgi:hypothetical protein